MTDLPIVERLRARAKSARKTECAPEYQAYWRGYAEASEQAADEIEAARKQA
jgi:hypothetical protein